jgi:hypothetical protein
MLSAEAVSKNTNHIALFYSQVGIDWRDQHSRLVRLADADHYIYSFADEQHALQFHALFGGDLTVAPPGNE